MPNSHFRDTRDLPFLIQDVQRINESISRFLNKIKVINAEMHPNIQKSNISAFQKSTQIQLIETMTLNSL